ncbi:tryptophan synthase subunit alpha [Actinoplanes sp. LDG1-06]|uniref:Tryptophan synthase alpha chain n=1 Tax=Paractinoplanes ovalisporus TaxID=2810368 RepID=A0ABS2AUK0_9ACTN|nr:tryptophan synthase subunit alpha [Actinoplanes ovalisporus]MBM2623033.1 tryptophan synthase subunit alpha [Actinoplanes ovalisporus]
MSDLIEARDGKAVPPSTPEPARVATVAPQGRTLLVPYLTAGLTEDWTDYLLAVQAAGADAIEVGLPFSDPMLDGATIQQASDRALARGVTVASILQDLSRVRPQVRVPLIAFTYANLVFRPGAPEFCRRLAEAGVRGLIVPDLPLDEAAAVERAAAEAGVDLTLLVAPVTTDERLAEIVSRSRGYVYAISRMGTTGERAALASSAADLAARIKAAQQRSAPSHAASSAAPSATTSLAAPSRVESPAATAAGRNGASGARLPVLVGFGVSGPEQAVEAGRAGDGVVVGSALMRRVLDGATPADLGAEVAAMRAALDRADQEASADHASYAEISGHRG